jgi:two-component system, NarL family, response regulator
MLDEGFVSFMKVIVISNYSLIREGILSIISKQEDISIQFVGQTIKEAIFLIKGNMNDVILLDIHKENMDELSLITELRDSGVKVKLMVLDFYGDNEIFIKALKNGVQGYILGSSGEEEILYAIVQVYKGKKYFDSYFIDNMVNEKRNLPCQLELLTAREREIISEIAKGLSNKRIAEKFLITEYTVKKHVNHIFQKLKINNRTEIALFASKYEIVNK